MLGILQPFRDAIKLFNKNLLIPENSNAIILLLSPILSLFLALLIVSILPIYNFINFDNKQNVLTFFVISRLGVYILLMVGWTSNSKYAHLGIIRRIAQIISYEISFFLIILFISLISNSFYFTQIRDSQYYLIFFLGNSLLFYF